MDRPDWIGVVESGYLPGTSEAQWLRTVVNTVRPLVDDGLGVVGFFFDRHRAGDESVWGVESSGADASFAATVPSLYARMPATVRDRLLSGATAATTTSEMLAQGAAPSNAGPDFVRAAAAQFGFADSLGIAVSDASGLGCIFGVPLRAATTIKRAERLRWAQLAAHLASGLRLHRTLARLDVAPDAVLDPSGRIDDASPAAGPRAIRDRLRNAVVAMERSRGPLRPDPTQALAGWHVLVDGRWSLVDRFESSGRRYLVALRNDVHLRDPRALTGRERSVAHALAHGRSNKLIAYELGIAEGTVSALVARVSTKLGAKSRADLVQWLATAASATVTHTSLGDGTVELAVARGATSAPQTLTAREAEVARGAVNGGSNESIAAELGIAPRTVANTLARVYRRLGVGSRWELARVFTEGSSQ